jgi:DNA-binding MarR family transcriptional regulator
MESVRAEEDIVDKHAKLASGGAGAGAGRAEENPVKVDPADSNGADQGWRTALAMHARAVYAKGSGAVGTMDGEGDTLQQLIARELGPLAHEAIQIVEAFAIGARTQRGSSGAGDAGPGGGGRQSAPQFDAGLAIILNGLSPDRTPAPRRDDGAPHIIQSELWQLLYKVRESAELSYAREIDLVELDRRILLLLRNIGPLVPAAISGAVGVDKAQVSRSVKRLLEVKMVERDQIRSPVTLTRKGAALGDRLLRLAHLRNRELTFDIRDQELAEFSAVIEKLLQRAILLYEQERVRASGEVVSVNPFTVDPEAEQGNAVMLDRSRIISPLMTLSAYFSRSGALTFKRLTGLSNFEVWVLNEIGRDSPMDWNTLVSRLDRDHSQAGRTVRALLGRGLIEREGRPGRRHGRFTPTAAGNSIYETIHEASRQRSAFLMAPLTATERESFLTTFEKVHRNAVVQLERERTFEELGQQ